MCFSNEPILSAEDYTRAVQIVGVLSSRNINIICVSFNTGCDIDILVANNEAVRQLPNPICISTLPKGQLWQSHYWGVRVRWFQRHTQTSPPTPAIKTGFWRKIFGVSHAH